MQTNAIMIFHEFSRVLAESDRLDIIRNGWGGTTPVKPIRGRTGTKVQAIEVSAEELAIWQAAKDRAAANVWVGFGGRR
jgi:hypothetical protein